MFIFPLPIALILLSLVANSHPKILRYPPVTAGPGRGHPRWLPRQREQSPATRWAGRPTDGILAVTVDNTEHTVGSADREGGDGVLKHTQ
jgi:hypothetical protein